MSDLHDDDTERHLLACLLSGHPIIADVADLVAGRDFYQPRHEAVYQACLTVHQRGDRIDPLTLPLPTEAKPLLVDLSSLPVVPVHALAYAHKLVDLGLRRRMVEATQQAAQVMRDAEDSTQAAEDVRKLVDEAAQQARTADGGTVVGDGLAAAIDWLEHPVVGAPTPWPDVNTVTNGLLAGTLITVAARPGHGKSLALKDVALATARQGHPVHIATLEMTRNEYMARIMAGIGRLDLGKMMRRQLSDGEWQRLGDAAERIRDLPMYLDDREGQSMAQIRAAARQTQRRFGKPLGLIGIDYCQLVRPAHRYPGSREREVAEISGAAKSLSKEFGCPVMLLAQLNRGNTQRTDHTPMVSDLRESGALEQDSDQVWLLHRPDQYDPEGERLGEVDLIVGKNRNGPAPVTVPLSFLGHHGMIASMV